MYRIVAREAKKTGPAKTGPVNARKDRVEQVPLGGGAYYQVLASCE